MAAIDPTAIVEEGVRLGADVEIGPYAIVRAGTVLGDGVTVGEHAVLGKRPKLGPKSVAKGGELPGLVVGAGSTISTHAIVYAGTTLGERVIIGDHAFVRERCTIAPRPPMPAAISSASALAQIATAMPTWFRARPSRST